MKLKLLLLLLIISCQNPTEPQEEKSNNTTTLVSNKEDDHFDFKLLAIIVKDIEASAKWYTDKVGFQIEKPIQHYPNYKLKIGMLQHDQFHLELIENETALDRNDLPLSEGNEINGVLKLGFMVKDIQKIFDDLKTHDDVQFITDIGTLPKTNIAIPWPKKYFLIQDLDGNLIQFFSYDDSTIQSAPLKPWLMGVTVKDLDNLQQWYQDHLGFQLHDIVGQSGNRRAILERNNCILELWEPERVTLSKQLPEETEFNGFKKIAFGIQDFDSMNQYFKNNKIYFALNAEPSDFDWATQALIIKDLESNWIQFFEIEH